jgi:heptosyltransferase II
MPEPTQTPPKIMPFKQEPKQILIVMPTWVGDVVMATPFLDAVFQRFSSAEITLLTQRHLFSLLEGSPWDQRVEFWPPRNKSPAARHEHKALLARLRQRQFDLAVMLPNSLRSAWLCWRSGARRRVGFSRDGRRFLLTDPIQTPNKIRGGYRPIPQVDYYARLALALGCEPSGDNLKLFTTDDCDRVVDSRLEEAGINGRRPLVVISPGANFGASKCWAPERFAGVADRLVDTQGAAIAMSPGPGEEPLAEAIVQAMQHPSALLSAPCLTLGELKSLISRADLLLGNDTGPRHFARAFNIPRVTIFGPTDRRWTDTSHDRESIVSVAVPCGPCHEKVCPLDHQQCMDGVTIDMVTKACELEMTRS